MKILVIGHARHGKDTVSNMIAKRLYWDFKDTSMLASELIVFDKLKDTYGYKSAEECHSDRSNHRREWFDLIEQYNTPDKARFIKEVFSRQNIYCGLRSQEEYNSALEQEVFDMVVGVWDSRKERESKNSMKLDVMTESDYIVLNSGSLHDLEKEVDKFLKRSNLCD